MIQIDNLKFSYGQQVVLDGVSMQLEQGRIYGLLGENGVGKTTLLTLLSGFKKPQAGSISIDGYKPYDRNPEMLSSIYYLGDEVAPQRLGADKWAKQTGAFWPGYSHEKFLTILSEFEVEPSKKMNEMSTGQLKKTYIAFSLALGVKYIFMDEPTNGLDIPSKSMFRKAIMTYTGEDSTIVISTHQVRDLENIIDPIVILDKREVLLNASIDEIAEKLFFDYAGTEQRSDALFCEPTPGGYLQVFVNTTGEESKVDVEALYNTVHSSKNTFKALFNK